MLNLVELFTSVFNRSSLWTASVVLLSCAVAMVTVPPAQAQTFVVLHAFRQTDGTYPDAGITLDPSENNLWGVTAYGGLLSCDLGGTVGCGVIFRLSQENSQWTFSVPYIFPGNDHGLLPTFPSQIAFGPSGTPYGAELEGGSLLAGSVYNLFTNISASNSNSPWMHGMLHQFGSGNDGAYPYRIMVDHSGNIFGTTGYGGTFNLGTVYELSPSGQGWTENTLYDFAGGADGQAPISVVSDEAGNLYGTTNEGGNAGCSPFKGCGTIFELTRSGPGTVWTKTTLHTFQQDTEGGYPGALMRDSSGNLFGLTSENGPDNFGVIWELSPSKGAWALTVLYSFTWQAVEDKGPFPPVMDASGVLYGFNNSGGTHYCGSGEFKTLCGNIYKLTPSDSGWNYSDLYDFASDNGGCFPVGPPAMDAAGNLYGVTYGCGEDGVGVVFEFTP
jgi:uncharacterized repeat protein (TIGR03803 family)